MEELRHGTFWGRFGSEARSATLSIQAFLLHLFTLSLFDLLSFPKGERLLTLFGNFNRVLLHFQATLLICLLDCLVARDQHRRWYWLASELLLNKTFLLKLLFSDHSFNFTFADTLRLRRFTNVKSESLRDCHSVATS